MRIPSVRVLAAGGGVAILLAGGAVALSGGGDSEEARAQAGTPTTVTTRAPTTTEPPPTTTTTEVVIEEVPEPPPPEPVAPDPGLLAVQERLAALGYDVGTPDGRAGDRTWFSVMAFQKVEGLTVDGQIGPQVLAALETASPPGPLVPGGESTRIEIDLDRQVLLFWQGGALARVLPVSTGNGEWYCVDGYGCDVAITPTGSYRIGRKAAGLEVSHLGELYNPMYFHLGWAIHGSPSVPPWPASHGCVRIPMYASASFFNQVPSGTRVHVLGTNPPTGDPPPGATTTTTAPPPTAPPTPTTAPPPIITVPTTAPDATTTTSTTVPATTTSSTTTTVKPGTSTTVDFD
jgi:peptidoglycan hydrolase-like protein with peptidoglycan-binding domain